MNIYSKLNHLLNHFSSPHPILDGARRLRTAQKAWLGKRGTSGTPGKRPTCRRHVEAEASALFRESSGELRLVGLFHQTVELQFPHSCSSVFLKGHTLSVEEIWMNLRRGRTVKGEKNHIFDQSINLTRTREFRYSPPHQ